MYLVECGLELLSLFLQLWSFDTHHLRQELVLETPFRGNEVNQRALAGCGAPKGRG